MEYYSNLKRKEILTHSTTWTNLGDITLSEIIQSQKTSTVQFHLYEVPRVAKFLETDSGMVIPMAQGRGIRS